MAEVSEAAMAKACELLDAECREPVSTSDFIRGDLVLNAFSHFIQDVSDAAKEHARHYGDSSKEWAKLYAFILPDPVDPLLIEARKLVECTVHWSAATDRMLQSGQNDSTPEVKIALAALKRGMELAK